MKLEPWRLNVEDNVYIGRNKDGIIFIQLGERVLELEEGDINVTGGRITTDKDGIILNFGENNIQIIYKKVENENENENPILGLVKHVYRIEQTVNNMEIELNNSPEQVSKKGETIPVPETHEEEEEEEQENGELVSSDIRILSARELSEILKVDIARFRSKIKGGIAIVNYEENGEIITRKFKRDGDRIVEVDQTEKEEIATFKKGEDGTLQEVKTSGTNSDATGDGR